MSSLPLIIEPWILLLILSLTHADESVNTCNIRNTVGHVLHITKVYAEISYSVFFLCVTKSNRKTYNMKGTSNFSSMQEYQSLTLPYQALVDSLNARM